MTANIPMGQHQIFDLDVKYTDKAVNTTANISTICDLINR